jgi:F-type H+-transporting ATPase subunit c
VVVEEERRPVSATEAREEEGGSTKMLRRIGTVMTMAGMAILMSPLLAMAQEAANAAGSSGAFRGGLIAIGANIGVGIAAFGSGLGQGRMAASAMESIGRNPNSAGQIFVPMIIGLAFIEALTLYSLVIAFFLQAKI